MRRRPYDLPQGTQHGRAQRIEAAGAPLKFYETVPKLNISGSAGTAVFLVPELRLTLTDYVITDPGGNAMKGKTAIFDLAP